MFEDHSAEVAAITSAVIGAEGEEFTTLQKWCIALGFITIAAGGVLAVLFS